MTKLSWISTLALFAVGCDLQEVDTAPTQDVVVSAGDDASSLEEGEDPCGVDLSGWSLEHDGGGVDLPEVVVPARSTVLVTAGATRAQLEEYWGVSLGDDALVVRGEAVDPGASFTLLSDAAILDGPTYPFEAGMNARRRGNSPGDRANGWHVRATDYATPGDGPAAGPHIRVSEIADVPGDAPAGVAYVEIYVGGGWTDSCDGALAPNDPGETPATCDVDADCASHPDGAACHPFGHFCGVDISDYGVIQNADPRSRYFASPTIVPAGTAIVLTRTGTQAEFEAAWGIALGPDALFVTTGGTFPAIDGDETYLVQAPGFVVVDGPTPASVVHGTLARDVAGWAPADPTPGTAACSQPGLWLSEISDTEAEGYDDHEYVELCVGPPS